MLVSTEGGLRVENLGKKMPGFFLEANFTVGPNERIALVGASGTGKTTLLRMIAGLERFDPKTDSGRIYLGSREITDLPVQKRKVGFVFQEQALFSGKTIFENIAFGLEVQKISTEGVRAQVMQWLEKLGLSGRALEKVDHLSGGERQRVALARALITKPALILMDEPFVGLDSNLRHALYAEMARLHADNPVPLLFVSHDEEDARHLATGRLAFHESPDGKVRSVAALLPRAE